MTPPIFLCPLVNFVPFGKNNFLVVSSNKLTLRSYFIYLLISNLARGQGGRPPPKYSGWCLRIVQSAIKSLLHGVGLQANDSKDILK